MVFIRLGRHNLVDNVIHDQMHRTGFHRVHWHVFYLLYYERAMRLMRL